MGKPTVGLVMNVRDESAVIDRCLRSVRDHIDYWTICDTGSSDGTKSIIQKALDGVPGQMVTGKWVNFGVNRTRTLRRAKDTADYLLLLDADMTLQVEDTLGDLDADTYNLTIHEGPKAMHRLPALVRGNLAWKFEGPTHEYLTGNNYPVVPAINLNTWTILHHHDGSRRPEKFQQDLELLTEHLQSHPNDARSVFYLAQTLRDMGHYLTAAQAYERRIMMGGWAEEVWYAHYQKGVCLLRAREWAEGRRTLLAAYMRRPSRAEPLYALTQSMIPPDDMLFLELEAYGS